MVHSGRKFKLVPLMTMMFCVSMLYFLLFEFGLIRRKNNISFYIKRVILSIGDFCFVFCPVLTLLQKIISRNYKSGFDFDFL